MATMLPERVTLSTTKSEQDVFKAIRDAPGSDGYTCLHSVGLARHKRKSYGEADFILVGPKGVFCLEVKGGYVRREGGAWTIGWPRSQYVSHEGPFKQAQQSLYPLMDEIERRISGDFRRRVLFGWGVVFPDIRFDEEDPEWDLDVVCDITHKNDLMAYIARLARYTHAREKVAGRVHTEELSHEDCKRIIDCFRRDFDLVPRVRDLIIESKQELAELSTQQYSVLVYALDRENPRVLCKGAAGTGKTLIGLEAARRLGRQGKRVLLMCFNRILAQHLKGEISADDGEIEVWALHRFMRHIIEEAGYLDRLRESEYNVADSEELFREIYPDFFETAALELSEDGQLSSFDVLIVDEGQDVLFSPTIDALALVLHGGLKDGNWIFLFDPDLQSEVYGRMDQRVLDTLSRYRPANLPLNENFRNPEPVVDEMCAVTGLEKPECRREFTSRVDYRTFHDEKEQGKKLRALLIELLRDKVLPSSVTILSSRRREECCVERFPPEVGKEIVYLEGRGSVTPNKEAFTACSVSGFKGMENEIIILTDIAHLPGDDQWMRSIVYVGMTRARTRLYVLVSHKFISDRFGSCVPGEQMR